MKSNLVVVRRNKKIKIYLYFLESISFILIYKETPFTVFSGPRRQKKPLGISYRLFY